MPLIEYVSRSFSKSTELLIEKANEIIGKYQAQGYSLTLRQLYYQFVAADTIPNTAKSYKRLGSVINDARLAGLIDWNAIEDRTRNLHKLAEWETPQDIVSACAQQFRIDKWDGQAHRVECFPPDTLVFTPSGQVCIGALADGDIVVSGSGEWRLVTKVFCRNYSGEMAVIRAVGLLPITCTPEHPVWCEVPDTSTKHKGSERRFLKAAYVAAAELPQFGLLRIPRMLTVANTCKVSLLPGPRSYDPGAIDVDCLFLRVIGFYLAEGSVRSDERTVQFTFGSHERDYANEVIAWATRYKLGNFEATGDGTLIVYICSAAFARWVLSNFGTGSHVKHLPGWILHLPSEKQLVMLKAYFQGDGHYTIRSAIVVTTFSAHLAQDVQRIMFRCGYCAALDEIFDKTGQRYRCSVGGASGEKLAELWNFDLPKKGLGRSARYNHIRMSDDYVYVPIRCVDSVDYDGVVVNLEVEEDHTYMVPFDVHNCWIEKEALAGVFERVCDELQVPFFSCRGYTSQSEMWVAGMRLKEISESGQEPVVLHFGDHDPSGMDMTRDIRDRLEMFIGASIELKRLALNMDQVEKYDPPPNPAKTTDSRYTSYIELYGNESWELDALEPAVLAGLVRDAIAMLRDDNLWRERLEKENEHKRLLSEVSLKWSRLTKKL